MSNPSLLSVRVKCHRYWPRVHESVTYGSLQVTCLKEEETPGFAFREFTLIDTEVRQKRDDCLANRKGRI